MNIASKHTATFFWNHQRGRTGKPSGPISGLGTTGGLGGFGGGFGMGFMHGGMMGPYGYGNGSFSNFSMFLNFQRPIAWGGRSVRSCGHSNCRGANFSRCNHAGRRCCGRMNSRFSMRVRGAFASRGNRGWSRTNVRASYRMRSRGRMI